MKGVKRKSSQLKDESFEDEDSQPKQKLSKANSQSPKTPKHQQGTKQFSRTTHSRSSKFEPFDYQQANYSRFQSGDQRQKSLDVKSHFVSVSTTLFFLTFILCTFIPLPLIQFFLIQKKQKNKNFKASASKATRGIEGSRGGKSRGRGRGKF